MRVDGEQGETVTVDIGLSNHGPAWIGALRSGGEPLGFSVRIPEGASVVDSPCRPMNDETKSEYLCFADTPFLEDDRRTFPSGSASTRSSRAPRARSPFPSGTTRGRATRPTTPVGSCSTAPATRRRRATPVAPRAAPTAAPRAVPHHRRLGDHGRHRHDRRLRLHRGRHRRHRHGRHRLHRGTTGGQSPQGGQDGLLASTGSTALLALGRRGAGPAAGGVLFAVSRRRNAADTA
ncbi:hypothetical protein LV779_16720 [Streptomyces thinghirensis]|nr:hypothetical protein [Streptomyces thinghirensis]